MTLLITAAVAAMSVSAPNAFAAGPPGLTFPVPPPGRLGSAYADTLTVNGGNGPFTWSVSSGSLPAGITLASSSGALSGTPTEAGTFTFTIQVTDASDQTASKPTSLVITPATALTASAPSVNFGRQVTFTATTTPAGASGSVTFRDLLSSGPKSGQSVTLGTAALSGGTATLTIALPAFNTNTVTASYGGDASFAADTSAPTGVQVAAYSGEVIINEFRLSGPAGASDQYAELYNTGPAVPLDGFTLTASSGGSETIPADAPALPTGHAYLIAGGSYSLSAVAAPDQSAASLGSAGLQLTAPDGTGTVTDAAGSAGAQSGFFSGTPLPALSGTPAEQYAWVRLGKAGVPVSTGSNAADFHLVSTTGGIIGGIQSALGSPSPLASGSLVQANASLLSHLLDPRKGALAAPNFIYQPGAPGRLTIRRTITNATAATITSAQLRISSLSEASGAPRPGVTTQPPVAAQLRVINPATATTQITVVGGRVVTVQNLSVNPPATAAAGGGLNTTLTIPLAGGGLAPGATVSITLSFAVDRHGPYWFGYDVDAPSNLVTIIGSPRHTRTTIPLLAGARAATRYARGHGHLPPLPVRPASRGAEARVRG